VYGLVEAGKLRLATVARFISRSPLGGAVAVQADREALSAARRKRMLTLRAKLGR